MTGDIGIENGCKSDVSIRIVRLVTDGCGWW